MMTTMIIINIILLIFLLMIGSKIVMAITVFEELLVKFVEMNNNYYKNQNHALNKLSELNNETKKLSNIISTLKKISIRINNKNKE